MSTVSGTTASRTEVVRLPSSSPRQTTSASGARDLDGAQAQPLVAVHGRGYDDQAVPQVVGLARVGVREALAQPVAHDLGRGAASPTCSGRGGRSWSSLMPPAPR